MSSLACCGGFIDKGEPTGKVITLDGISTYTAEPADPCDTLVVVATDAFGYTLPNSRLIADSFAKQSFLVIVPDLFNGKECSATVLQHMETLTKGTASFFGKAAAMGRAMYHFVPFMLRNKFPEGQGRLIKALTEIRRQRPEIKQVAVQGYCWGGKIAVLLAQTPGLVDAVCSAHPATLKLPDEIDGLKAPTLIVAAENDFTMKPTDREQIEKLLTARTDIVGKVKLYEGSQHGFAVRGNENDPKVCAQRVDAFESAVKFFKEVLKKDG